MNWLIKNKDVKNEVRCFSIAGKKQNEQNKPKTMKRKSIKLRRKENEDKHHRRKKANKNEFGWKG